MTAVILALLAVRAPAGATELVMFESEGCTWCEAWDEEIASVYPKTAEGKLAPLRRVDIDDEPPADLRGLKAVIYTPTFVLMDKGQEIGRVLGYPGEEAFWALLDELMVKLAAVQKREVAGCPGTAMVGKTNDREMKC